jgi:ABC-type hemin transport system ATPase subunit
VKDKNASDYQAVLECDILEVLINLGEGMISQHRAGWKNVVFLGPTDAGKSTLFSVFSGKKMVKKEIQIGNRPALRYDSEDS